MRVLPLSGAPLLLIPALLVLVGCSISASSQSSSDAFSSSESSSHSATSSSRSSSGTARQTRYRDDVRTTTAAYVRSGGEFEAFEKELSDLARRHGLTNWEDDQTTYVGIGEGLSDAAVAPALLAAYKARLSGSDTAKMHAIQQGYDAAQ